MKHSSSRASSIGVTMLLLVVACASNPGASSTASSPSQICQDVASSLCERMYTCHTAAELKTLGFPAAEADCVTMVETRKSCATLTPANACTAGTYQPDQAASCSDEVASLTCSQIRVPAFNVNLAAPACAAICR
jgi:hypothetical protein